MTDDLVERVARAIALEIRTVTESDVRAFELTPEEYAALARAALAVALEEAAKVADAAVSQQWQGRKISAAIRALKESK